MRKASYKRSFRVTDLDLKAKIKAKRQRSENWCEEDKELLVELVRRNVKAIENKNTDTNSNQTKKRAWLDVEKEFNSISKDRRNVIQLKTQWTAIKINARKRYRTKATKTEGEQSSLEISSRNDINMWLPKEFIVDENQYDSDINFLRSEEENTESCAYTQETPSESEILNIKDIKQEEYSDFELLQKPTPCQKKVPTENVSINEESILKKADIHIECRQELHQLQIEAEKKRIRNLDLEFELIQAKFNFFKRKSFGVYLFN